MRVPAGRKKNGHGDDLNDHNNDNDHSFSKPSEHKALAGGLGPLSLKRQESRSEKKYSSWVILLAACVCAGKEMCLTQNECVVIHWLLLLWTSVRGVVTLLQWTSNCRLVI